MTLTRSRWAAIGAAVAVTLGAGSIGLVNATSPAGAATFVSITPCRVADTRPDFNVGSKNTPLGAGLTMTVPTRATMDNPAAGGECSGKIPAEATGVSLNVTAVGATAGTFLTVWPAGAPQPNSSSLNPVPGGAPTPNAVATGLSDAGQFSVFNLAGSVDVVIDINGYYVDHNHDDRYYTETEVNSITALTPIAGGTINADGTKGRTVGVGTTTYIDTLGQEHYEIQLTDIDYSNVDYATTVTPHCGGADASTAAIVDPGGPGSQNLLSVRVEVQTAQLGDCGFSFLVTRLPAVAG